MTTPGEGPAREDETGITPKGANARPMQRPGFGPATEHTSFTVCLGGKHDYCVRVCAYTEELDRGRNFGSRDDGLTKKGQCKAETSREGVRRFDSGSAMTFLAPIRVCRRIAS